MSDSLNNIYCIDTSCFRELARNYPRSIFPGVYDAFESLITQGRLTTIEDVLDEYIEDDVKRWIETQRHMLIKPKDQAIVECLKEIMIAHPEFVDPSKTRQEADQPLVALALTLSRSSGSTVIVVTQETGRGIPGKALKIPDACQCYDIVCVNLLRMMSLETWKFNHHVPGIETESTNHQRRLF